MKIYIPALIDWSWDITYFILLLFVNHVFCTGHTEQSFIFLLKLGDLSMAKPTFEEKQF